MKDYFILMAMIFCHILDDFVLQAACLNKLKQESWWKEQKGYKDSYRSDYLYALFMHSASWAFMIMLPQAIALKFNVPFSFLLVWYVNTFIHGIIDNLKANYEILNLKQDQSIHILQILITFAIYLLLWR